MFNFRCVCIYLVYICINVTLVESTQSKSNIILTGAPNFPSALINEFQRECGIETDKLTVDGSKNVYNDPKISKFIRLINEWYAKNNYIGSGVKNVRVEGGNKLHVTCNELMVDKYIPIEIHTFTNTGASVGRAVDTNPPNVLATLSGSKLIGKPTNERSVSDNFILKKLGLSPGKTFQWNHSKWAIIEACGLFKGNSVVKLVKNPKDGTVTLHLYVIENPTKIVGPFLGNILNAYKEPIFGLKFQHINLLGNGIIGTLCTSAGLSNEGYGFKSRPYKIVANLTYDIMESFVWLQNKLHQSCLMVSLKGFADNSKIGGLVKYNVKLSGKDGPRASLVTGFSSSEKLQSLTELRSSSKLLNCIIDTNSSVLGYKESNIWKFKYRGKLNLNLPINKTLSTAIECGMSTSILDNKETGCDIEIKGYRPPNLGKYNTSYDINLILYQDIPINLPTSKEDSSTVQIGKGVVGVYFAAGGGIKQLVKENIEKIESTIVATVGLMAGVNNARIFIGLPIIKVDNYAKPFNYFPNFDPKVTLDISVPINN